MTNKVQHTPPLRTSQAPLALKDLFLPGFMSLLLGGLCLARAGESEPFWYSVPIAVTGLPRQADFVFITTTVDLSALFARVNASGAPDERLLRLYHVKSGAEREVPVQFICEQQPRPGTRQLLASTPPNVSHLGEWPAGTT